MTPTQIELVRKSFARIVSNLDQVSALFCRHLRALDPDQGTLFGGDPVIQQTKVGAALAGLVGSLGRLDRIAPTLRALGRERARQGVDARYYVMVGEALVAALEQVPGGGLDAATRRAWIFAYGEVAWTMAGGAEDDRIVAARSVEELFPPLPRL
jgi:hemoglobin-like flavoprotein